MRLLWPFFKEFFLGEGTSVSEAVKKREWRRLVALYLMALSVAANLYLIPRSIKLSTELLNLQKELKEAKAPSVHPTVAPTDPVTPVPTLAPTPASPAAPEPIPDTTSRRQQPVIAPKRSPQVPHHAPSTSAGPDPERSKRTQERYDDVLSRMRAMEQTEHQRTKD